MKIHQREKTLDYILKNIVNEDLHFLKYEEFASKSGSIIRRFSSSSIMNLTILEMQKSIEDDRITLIAMEKETDL